MVGAKAGIARVRVLDTFRALAAATKLKSALNWLVFTVLPSFPSKLLSAPP